jgi:sugar lactone lactonase YvrE
MSIHSGPLRGCRRVPAGGRVDGEGARRNRLPAAVAAVFLAACGGGGGADPGTQRSGVTVDQPLTASVQAIAPGESVTYSARCRGGGDIAYEWDAGDGRAAVLGGASTAVYRYEREGRFLPRVTCRDSRGAQAVSAIAAPLLVAVPSHTLTRLQAERTRGAGFTEVAFRADCLGDPGVDLAIAWDFGDGSTGTGPAVTHRYADGGPDTRTATAGCTAARTVLDAAGRRVPAPQTVKGTTLLALAPGDAITPTLVMPLTIDPPIPTAGSPATFDMACAPGSGGPVVYTMSYGDGANNGERFTGFSRHTYEPGAGARQYTVEAACHDPDGRARVVQTLVVNVRTPTRSVLAGQVAPLLGDAPLLKDGTGAGAVFARPGALATDGAGNLYVSDPVHQAVRKVGPDESVTTLARGGGEGSTAAFVTPAGIAVDARGDLHLADRGVHAIWKVSPAGVASLLAGVPGQAGFRDGPAAQVLFSRPEGIAVDVAGKVHVADRDNHAVRVIDAAGRVTTLAGGGAPGYVDGQGAAARFSSPIGIALDRAGNVYVADGGNHAIRKIDSQGRVSTLAGGRADGVLPLRDGTGRDAVFNHPRHLAVDGGGNVYVLETGASIRKVGPSGNVTSLAALALQGHEPGFEEQASGLALSGRRLFLSRDRHLEQIDFVP